MSIYIYIYNLIEYVNCIFAYILSLIIILKRERTDLFITYFLFWLKGVVIDQVSSQYRKPSLISTSSYDIYNGGPSKPGISGYDPEEPDMRGVFMARGPGKLTKDLVLFY